MTNYIKKNGLKLPAADLRPRSLSTFNFKPLFFFSSLMFTLVLSSTPLVAIGEAFHPNNKNQTFTIMTEVYPPYNYLEKGGITGISTEIVREMLKRIGHPDNIKLFSWSRGYNLILKNDNHVLYSTTRSSIREDLFKWVGPLVPNKTVFFARKGSGISINKLHDAAKVKSIGTYKDDFGELHLKKEGFTNIDSVVDNRLNIKKLVAGRIDLWIINEVIGIHLAKKAGLADKIEPVFEVVSKQMYIAFSKNTPNSVIKKWQKVLDEIKSDGTYNKIFDKYGVKP